MSGVLCIYEVVYISPGSLDSSLCFFQSSVSHDVLAYKLNKQGVNDFGYSISIQFLMVISNSFPDGNLFNHTSIPKILW